MKRTLSIPAIIPLLLSFACSPASRSYAQGGKAEPLRVKFKRGASSASYQNRLRGSAEAEYEIEAREGQKMSLRLKSSPAASTRVEVKDPDGGSLALSPDRRGAKSVRLTKSGNYYLVVKRVADKAGTSRYSLTISIR